MSQKTRMTRLWLIKLVFYNFLGWSLHKTKKSTYTSLHLVCIKVRDIPRMFLSWRLRMTRLWLLQLVLYFLGFKVIPKQKRTYIDFEFVYIKKMWHLNWGPWAREPKWQDCEFGMACGFFYHYSFPKKILSSMISIWW